VAGRPPKGSQCWPQSERAH